MARVVTASFTPCQSTRTSMVPSPDMNLRLPDDVLAPYEAMAEAQQRDLATVLAQQLKRFQMLPPGKKAIVVGGDLLTQIEHLTGGMPIADGAALVARIAQLAGITFHRIHLEFSPQQLTELQHRATRQGRDVEVLAAEIVQSVVREMFWQSGGGEASVRLVPPTAKAS